MLIGNKCDLPSRDVSYDEAMEYAKNNKMSYMEVSAKTGQNVKNVFTCVVTEIHKCLSGKSQINVPQRQPGISIANDSHIKAAL